MKSGKVDKDQSIINNEANDVDAEKNDVEAQELQRLVTIQIDNVKNKTLTTCEIMKKSSRIGIPLFFNACIMGIANFGCAVILGNQGSTTLAASPYIFAAQTLPGLTGAATHSIGIQTAIKFGAENFDALGSILRNGQLLSLLLCVPPMVIIGYIRPIIEFLGCPESIAEVVQNYGKVYLFSVPLQQLTITYKLFIESTGATKITAVTEFFGALVLLGTGLVLSYGFIGLPALGSAGLAYGSIAQYGLVALLSELYLFFQRNKYELYVFTEALSKRFDTVKVLWKQGYPFIFLATGHIAANYVTLIMITQFGEVALSAQNIASHYEMLLGIPMASMLQASSILLGQTFGSKRFSFLRRYFDFGLTSALVYSSVALLLSILFPKPLTSLFLAFSSDQLSGELIQTIKPLYITNFIGLVEKSLLFASFNSLKGFGDTGVSTVISIGFKWLIGLPASAIVGFLLNLSVVGIMLGDNFGMLLSAVSMFLYWMFFFNKVLEKEAPEDVIEEQQYYIPSVNFSFSQGAWCNTFKKCLSYTTVDEVDNDLKDDDEDIHSPG